MQERRAGRRRHTSEYLEVGRDGLRMVLSALTKAWFEEAPREVEATALLIHELAHDKVSDHLSHDYHEECCRLGAELAKLALDTPGLFEVK